MGTMEHCAPSLAADENFSPSTEDLFLVEISNALTEVLCDCCWGCSLKVGDGICFFSPISTAQGCPVSVPRTEFILHALSTLLAAALSFGLCDIK